MKRVSASRTEAIRGAIADIRRYRFCGPSDDLDEITAVTLGYRHLLVQLKRLAAPILSESNASRLTSLDFEVNDLLAMFEVNAELSALLIDIEDALEEVNIPAMRVDTTIVKPNPLPTAVCAVIGDVLGSSVYHHATLQRMFYEAGAEGEVPEGNCVVKCQTWLKRLHTEVRDPLIVLGNLLEEFMEVDIERYDNQDIGRGKISDALAKFGLSYRQGGVIYGREKSLPIKSLEQQLRDRDLISINNEFDRCLENVGSDPPSAITAACSILESLFKLYIEDNGLEMPAKQTIMPLWKVVSKDLKFEPSVVEDDDIKKILSGFTSVVDGIGSLRTHAGSAHGRGRRAYRLQARHARLAVHASHTLVGFILETWDTRKH